MDWSAYVDLLKPAGQLLDRIPGPAGPAIEAALNRQLAMNIAQGYFMHFQSTPRHPEFLPFENSVFLAQPNPDGIYYLAPLEAGGVYRVVGQRGNAPVAGFGLIGTIIGMGNPPGPGYGNFDIDGMEVDADGRFEVIFSEEQPAGYTGNWRYKHPGAGWLLVRQFSVDWGNDIDLRVAIERLDSPPLKPAMTPEETDEKLRKLFGGYVAGLTDLCLNSVRRVADKGFVNKAKYENFNDYGNTDDWPQAYWECVFDIARDEALIIESDMPETHVYWNVQVIDALWNQVEMVYRQTSLNGHQAKLDPDGRFRAVLCADDPGLHNWLDTGGVTYGMMIGRWYRSSSHPLPTFTKVKLADLESHIPASAPRITPEERAAMLRARRLGAQLRRHW
jgi:hypothetical protein